jgi:hypothetical protein
MLARSTYRIDTQSGFIYFAKKRTEAKKTFEILGSYNFVWLKWNLKVRFVFLPATSEKMESIKSRTKLSLSYTNSIPSQKTGEIYQIEKQIQNLNIKSRKWLKNTKRRKRNIPNNINGNNLYSDNSGFHPFLQSSQTIEFLSPMNISDTWEYGPGTSWSQNSEGQTPMVTVTEMSDLELRRHGFPVPATTTESVYTFRGFHSLGTGGSGLDLPSGIESPFIHITSRKYMNEGIPDWICCHTKIYKTKLESRQYALKKTQMSIKS